MNTSEAARMVRKLERSDILHRLGFRLAAWASVAFAVWAISLFVSVCFDEGSALWLPPLTFHTIVLAAIGFLPAFMAAPFDPSSGIQAIRRVDKDTAVESWLEYPAHRTEHPASRLLEKNAFVVLSVAAIAGFGRPKPSRPLRLAVVAMASFGLLAFVSSQMLSIQLGYGVSLSYPDKSIVENALERTVAQADDTGYLVVPAADGTPDDETDAPGSRRYAGPGFRDAEALGEPDVTVAGRAGDSAEELKSAKESSGYATPKKGADPSSGTAENGSYQAGKGSSPGEVTPGTDSPGTGDTTGQARTPGYEGSGSALEASPLVDYRARFERQISESSGTETTLGKTPSSEVVSAAIAAYFSSFDLRVVIGQPIEPTLARVQESWSQAFGTGTVP